MNERPNAPRRDFDVLKAILHICVVRGPDSQIRSGHPDFRAHLLGRIGWMQSLNVARGLRLRRDFEKISW